MTDKPIYLDHNATTAPSAEVIEAVCDTMQKLWANPSSVHRFGQQVRQRIELARLSIATLINADPAEIVLTSGGTESINLALQGSIAQIAKRTPITGFSIITSNVEHSAVRETVTALEHMGATVVRLPVDKRGVLQPEILANALHNCNAANQPARLVSIQWANNETGVIQPIEQLLTITKTDNPKTLFHTDAVQAVGKIPVDTKTHPVDFLSFAAHKMHGPNGVGALFIKRGTRTQPITLGGSQERNRRGGTENAAGIVGFGVAAQQAAQRLADWGTESSITTRIAKLRDQLESKILSEIPNTRVNGGCSDSTNHDTKSDGKGQGDQEGWGGRLWNTTNIGFHRLEAEAMLLMMSERGLYVSAGAACSSGSLDPSPVLLAMGVPETYAHGSIRFSLSESTTEAEIVRAYEIIRIIVTKLSKTLPHDD